MNHPRATSSALKTLSPEQDPSHPQRAASQPKASAWVAASAGSGKTKVLTDRILRLLLAGAAPERILCLTFTKAAAAEMSGRLLKRLAQWATIQDQSLAEDLQKLSGKSPGVDELIRARQLFVSVLDCPGGIKIQTIHAFCKTLLARFPCEAGLPPNFRLLDDSAAAEHLHAAEESVMAMAAKDGESALGRTLAFFAIRMADKTFQDMLRELLGERGKIERALRYFGGHEQLCAHLRQILQIGDVDTPETILDSGLADAALDGESLREASRLLLGSSPQDSKRGQILATYLADTERRRLEWPEYGRAFLTAEGEPYKNPCTQALAKKYPHLPEVLRAETQRLQNLREQIATAALATETSMALRLAEAVLSTYQAAKQARGELDYTDLIHKAADLLDSADQAAWVLFKLDHTIEHILIDEAQDTSAAQWRIVRALSQDFFAGDGRELRPAQGPRTLFAVGDAKQSIYGFQGAAPHLFRGMQDNYAKRIKESGQDFHAVQMNISFRSTAAVLRVVDEVFAADELAAHLNDAQERITHRAFREGQAGHVELWPLCQATEPTEERVKQDDAWGGDTAAFAASAQYRLAESVASQIAHMLDSGDRLESANRPLAPGDFLILVRKRGGLMFPMIRALKKRGIPCAGADRMALLEQLIVKDLLALGDCLILPGDNLALAALLKSPLFGLSDDELFTLCHGRDDTRETLWQRLRATALDEICAPQLRDKCAASAEYLNRLFVKADYVRPYELLLTVLDAPCPADGTSGRHAFLGRLGNEIVEPLDHLLDLALRYEGCEAPTLQGFLAWIRRVGGTVKRETSEAMEGPHNAGQVRIMTIHGAKGLQAPVVFLAGAAQSGSERGSLLFLEDINDYEERRPILPFFPCTQLARSSQSYKNLRDSRKANTEAEYTRLLYVALTRASDRLYICGAAAKNNRNAPWYSALSNAFARIPDVRKRPAPAHLASFGLDEIWQLSAPQTALPDQAGAPALRAKTSMPALPAWMTRPPPDEPAPARPLTPSRPVEDDAPVLSPRQPADRNRFKRGILIHKLLQILPDLAPDERAQAASRLLDDRARDLSAAERKEIAEETMRIFDDPATAELFAPGSIAEAPIAGLVGNRIISGQIDRIRITGDSIWLVDYKTNRAPPQTISGIPSAYISQMRAYAEALRTIYPRHKIRAALLWTAAPRIMFLPDDVLM